MALHMLKHIFFLTRIIQFGPCFLLFELFCWLKHLKTNIGNDRERGPCLARAYITPFDTVCRVLALLILHVRRGVLEKWFHTHFNIYHILNCTVIIAFILIWNLCNFWFKSCLGLSLVLESLIFNHNVKYAVGSYF